MIYLIKSGNFIKIGYSIDECTLNKRFKTYNTHNPDYEILDIYYGDREDEKKLHKLCAQYKYKTEWFNYSEDILEIIDIYICENKLRYTLSDKQFLEKLFNTDLEETNEEIGEIYYSYRLVFNTSFICNIIVIDKNTVFIHLSYPGKGSILYKMVVRSLKKYFKDYNENEDVRCVNANMINDVIVAEIREYGRTSFVSVYDDLNSIPKCINVEDFKYL